MTSFLADPKLFKATNDPHALKLQREAERKAALREARRSARIVLLQKSNHRSKKD